MAKRKPADERLPRRVNGPSLDDLWLEPERARIQQADPTSPLHYLLTDREGIRMLASGLLPEYFVVQAKRALEGFGE